MTDLTLKDNGHCLTADVDGHQLEIRYGWANKNTMRVDFVGVPKALEGRGYGTQLVGALVKRARKQNFRLQPICGFARQKLAQHEDWHDVLA